MADNTQETGFKHVPTSDATDTLGMIHFRKEGRDAVHFAVEPVTAAVDLQVGQKVGVVDGLAWPVGATVNFQKVPYHGIIDPFLPEGPKEGQDCWFILRPRMVHSLRHIWEHPDFPAGK